MAKATFLSCITSFLFITFSVAAASNGEINFFGRIMSDSCVVTVRNQTIDLGKVSRSSLALSGSESERKPFEIDLNGCDPGQSVKLKLTAQPMSGFTDVIQTVGNAANVGIGIWEKGSTSRLIIDGLSVAKEANFSGLLAYSFEAAYVSLGNPVSGSANATVVFEVIYP